MIIQSKIIHPEMPEGFLFAQIRAHLTSSKQRRNASRIINLI